MFQSQSDQSGSVSKQSLSKCFIVTAWKKGSKVIHVEVFEVASNNLKKGSKVIIVDVSKQSLSKCFKVIT